MRKRKQPPVAPTRTMPTTTSDPVRDRRLLIPLSPALAELATGLLPAPAGSEPAAWTSWALQDQPRSEGFAYWEAPVVDGATCSGGGVGFPERPADATPVTIDDYTSATAAGWPYDPGPPAPERSWVHAVGSLGLDSDATAADATDGAATHRQADHPPATWPPFLATDVHDAMALHPSARRGPEPGPDASDVIAPSAPASDVGASDGGAFDTAIPAFDIEDFMTRFERGAAIALTERHLHALAERALERLAPRSTSTWFAEQPDGRLEVALARGDGDHAGCGVADRASCPALVTGVSQRFDRSDELDACPQLRERTGPACAAVCTPVSSRGPLRGVVFVSGPAATPLDEVGVTLIEHVAATIARRVTEVHNAVGSTGPSAASD